MTAGALHRHLGGHRVYWSKADEARIVARYGRAFAGIANIAANAYRAPELPASVQRAEGGSGKSFSFTISTASVDRYNDTIAVDGWRLAQFAKNPVVLFSHDAKLLPLGRATRTWIEGGRLKSTVHMASALSGEAAQVERLISGGFLRAASVGFRPLKFKFADDPKRKLGIDFQEQELLEWSICVVGANAECLIDSGQMETLSGDAARRARDLDAMRMRA